MQLILTIFDIQEKDCYDRDMNLNIPAPLLYILFIWSLLWNGLALWHAARNEQRNWFIVLLIIHTAGILEVMYLFVFAKKKFKVESLLFWRK